MQEASNLHCSSTNAESGLAKLSLQKGVLLWVLLKPVIVSSQ